MGLFDKIKEFVAGEEESPVTAASVLAKVREKYPHLRGIDDLSLSQSLYKKDPAKFSYLKTYAPDTTVPPALVPKSMRDDAFYKANPQEGTKDALKVIEQVKAKFPKYKGVDAKKLAVALETKNPTMFAGLSKKLMPGQTAIPKGETEAATIPLIPSGTMGATKPVSPVQVTPPVRPIETKPEPKVRPSVTSISPEEAKLPAGTKPLKFKNGIEAYLAVEKLAKPTLVEYPGRHGQTIRRIMTTEIPSFPPPPEDKGKDLVGKIVGKEEAFARGVGVSGVQIPELAYGATALVADSAEKLFGSGTASRVKDWALRGYQRASKVSEEVHGDEVKSVVESWKEAKKGNLDALGDWLSYWSGYAAGQLGESAAVAFLGGLVGSVVPGPGTAAGAVAGVTAKTATKGVIRGALERLVERQALKLTAEGVVASEAKKLAVKQIATAIGAASAIGAYAVVQEGGSIYPDAVKKAEEDGRKLNGYDLGRVWGTIFVAAGAEGLGDMLGLGFLTGKVRIPGRLGKVARIVGTAASGGLAEGGTEAIQTAVERVGAGRKPFDQEGIQAIIESAAAGAIPGLGAGGVGATISGQPRANVQSLAATQEASPELLSYLDRVEKINRARLEMPEKLDLTPERPQMQPFVPAPPIPRSTAPVNEIVKTHAKSIMNEAVSEYNLERDRFSRWRDLIGPGLRPPRVLPGNRDVMGEYNTLPVWQKSGKGRFADEVAEEAVSVGLISKPEDIYDALRSLKAPSNPSRNVEDYYDEAQRFVDAEQPDTQPERKYPETEMPNFSASKKEDVTKGPARAEFIGYQEGLPEDTPIPLYNVMGESPRALSTVGSEELKSLGIETPKTPSFEEWKAGGDVTEGQVSAKKLIEKLASANEISDAVAVEFVKHITPTGENFYKSYGEEFSPEKFRVLGATIPRYTQNGLNFAIKLAQGAKESTGAHEMFHAMKQMGFFSQDEMRVLEGRFGNEEKIADALGEYATRRTGAEAQSRIKAIFDRFLEFVKRVGSMLVGRGWTRPEDIFESVVKGRPGKRASGSEGSTRFSAPPQEPVFYSQLQRTIEAKMPNQAPADQVKGIIGGGAVKQDEIDWSGVNDFLEGKKTVTKAELLDFLKANEVQVKEVVKGDSLQSDMDLQVNGNEEDGWFVDDMADESEGAYKAGPFKSEMEAERFIERMHGEGLGSKDTKFSKYQLPGGENYREVLLTLPIMKGESAKNIVDAAMRRADELDWDWSKLTTAEKQKLYNEIENRVGGTKQKFISSHFDEPNILAHVRMNDRVSFPVGDRPSPLVDPEGQKSGADSLAADAKLLSDVVESAAFREKGLGGLDVETRKAVLSGVVRAVRDPQVFRGVVPLIPVDVVNNLVRAKLTAEQFLRDEAMLTDSLSANPDAAIKLSEGAIGRLVRSVADLTTKRVFGSTDGRGKFIAGSSAPSAIDSHRGKRILFIEEIQSDWAQGLRAGKDHPKMPFAKTWHELALKRMLRYAVDNGYDGIAWTTGEQQAERYDLSKQLSEISYSGTNLKAFDKEGAEVISRTGVTPEELPDLIGKDAAQKLMEQKPSGTLRRISGLDLKVGGEGMKGFYDQIIPSFLNKYTKKWGGRVGESKINTGPSEENRTALQEAERTGDSALIADAAGKGKDRMETVHSLDITPAMRESLSQGQPMFKAEPKDQTQTPEFKRWFGNSKVVDADGKPLVVYHGTNSNFDVFENKGGTVSTFISNEKVERSGLFFTPDEKFASEFGGKTIPAFLSIKKLADFQYPTQELFNDLEANGFNTRFFEVRQPNEYWEAFDGSVGEDFVSALTKAGYDGAKIVESDADGRLRETFVALSPTQIKSATGNSGTFDPNNPSILYQAERIPPTPETPGSPYFAAPRSNAHRRVPPPVLEALQSAEGKLNDLTVGQAGELSTLAPTRAMEVMDGKRFGLMKEHFLKPIQDADKSFQIELKSMRAEAKAVLHGLTADERRSVYNAIDLKHQIHSDKVKRAVDFLRKTYDDLLDRINTARAAAGKDPVQKRQNYITHYQELSVLNDILDMIGLNMTEVPNSMLTISMFTKPNSPYFQFAKRRLGEQTERDAEQAFLRYLEPALRTIHFSPATKNARDIIEYKVKIPSEYEGGKIDTVSLFGIRYPNAYRYLTNYLNVVSGKRPILDKIFPQGAAIAGVMNKLFAAGSIGGNISTVITQAASLRNTIAETGLFAFKGQMLINTPKGYRFFKKNSRIGLGRQYEPSTKGTRLLGSKALAKTHEAVSDLISIPVGLFDREMVGGAFLAGYFKGRSIGLSEADAIRYGDDVAERTQASANIVDRPPINTGKLKTALGQFQTFVYNEWSQIRNDMVKKAVLGENSKQGYGDGLSGIREGRDVGFKRFLYFSIAAIILSSMYDEADLPNPLKQEAFSLPFGNHHVNTVFQHIVNQIPFVGNIRFGGPPVVQMIKLSVDVFGPVRDRKIALRRLQNLGLRLIPGGGQISKSINAHRYFFKVPPQTMADKVRGYMFGPRRWKILNDDMRWLKENAGRLGLTRSKAYQYLNRTSTRSLLAETEKERTEARAKVESYAKRLRAMAESREAELLAREERRKARLAARR